jgi:predicted Rossmann fold flavoprotein
MEPSPNQSDKNRYDVIILGAGGAGMMCAIHAGKRHREVLVLDHAPKLGGKILISGGGRCNFTNLGASPAQYVSQNPHFMKSAMSRFTPRDFIDMVEAHQIAYHEKKLGQQFCDGSATQIVDLLEKECEDAGVTIELNSRILSVKNVGERAFEVRTYDKTYTCESVVIATGGLSIPKIGATGFGYDIAQQFKLKLIERAAALDGFTLSHRDASAFEGLAGVSVDTVMTTNGMSFRENILFTHAGLSGPATLQASLHWRKHDEVVTNLVPDQDAFQWFLQKKKEGNKSLVRNLLSELIAGRLADRLCALYFEQGDLPLPQVSEKALEAFCKEHLHAWTFVPSGTVGYSKAEVTRGGVDTDELSSKTMETKKVPGLYFIGEVVDVTGWLGGYNFQWAWTSGAAAGQVV